MTKLTYPSEGIYSYGQKHIEDTIESLKTACSKSYSCPSNFKYASYVKNLRSNLMQLYREANLINNKLKKVDNSYERLSNSLMADKRSLEVTDLKERERMII